MKFFTGINKKTHLISIDLHESFDSTKVKITDKSMPKSGNDESNTKTNDETGFHIIFVLDRSSSMNKDDIKPKIGFGFTSLVSYLYLQMGDLDNRLGAVYQAVKLIMSLFNNLQNLS